MTEIGMIITPIKHFSNQRRPNGTTNRFSNIVINNVSPKTKSRGDTGDSEAAIEIAEWFIDPFPEFDSLLRVRRFQGMFISRLPTDVAPVDPMTYPATS